MERNCDACGEAYEAKSKQSQFCKVPECRRTRARARKQRSRGGEVLELPARESEPSATPLTVEAATLAQLTAADRVESPAGQNALVLARRLDQAMLDRLETGSSVSALSKQHLAVLSEAVKDAKVAADPVDELKERRERRRA